MIDPQGTYTVNEYELLKVAAAKILPPAVVHDMQLDVCEQLIEGLVYKLQGYVLADRLAPATQDVTITYERPESWWQHTKAVHFPTFSQWLRRPPRYVTESITKTINIESLATFPEAQVATPPDNFGRHRRVQTVSVSRA